MTDLPIVAGVPTQEESVESSENQKEENIEKQDNTDKSKAETKTMIQENVETSKKEVCNI